MATISTHVLDISKGQRAKDIAVILEVQGVMGSWKTLGKGKTDADGRCDELLPQGSKLQGGTYRLSFDTAAYFRSQSLTAFVFMVRETDRTYHLLSC